MSNFLGHFDKENEIENRGNCANTGVQCISKQQTTKKQKDPGSFTVSCSIGELDVGHALCYFEASINLMQLSIFKKLGISKAQPTSVTLQLSNRTIKYPEGKIEDVLIKVDNFIFLADFIILDYEADRDVPIILGRPFLATGKVLIDMHKGEFTIRVDSQEVKCVKRIKVPR
ncbi:uncharacterized protein LOC120077308 [Benincasa hispida]|uniref:uncharacterized protein LOC120077308 n=1 Tax=Benincasa hispida TaxID=102211 RepID=UPI0019029908|nr:uncharacterized protein LOC120077308 [Benincasa hispida]